MSDQEITLDQVKKALHPRLVADFLRSKLQHQISTEDREACQASLVRISDEIQDACNGTAVALALHDTGRALLALGLGSDGVHSHKAFKNILGKLCSLSLIDYNWSDAHSD